MVVAVTVSIAVLAGGTVGCAGDDPVPAPTDTSADQPAVPQTPTPEAAAEPDPDPSADGSVDESEPTDIEALGEGEDDPGGGAAEASVESTETRSQRLSTGPVLEWTEVDPGFDDLFQFESVGDGQVIARAWTDGDGQGLFGQRMVVSDNGTDWTELALPEGLFPEQVNISADRWVVTGRYPDSTWPDAGPDRLFFSDDEGATWTETIIDVPSEAASPYVVERWWASPVLVEGRRMVLVLSTSSDIDGETLLDDLGRLPPDKRVVFALPTPDGVTFTLVDSDAHEAFAAFTSGPSGLSAVYGYSNEELPVPAYEELELTYDEVGFTESEMFELFAPSSVPVTRIFASDGATGEVVASYEGWILSGAATAEGFLLVLISDDDTTVLTSPDGLVWSEGRSFGPAYGGAKVSTDGTIWWAESEMDGSFDVQRARPGAAPEHLATFDGVHYPGRPVVGPAGLVVVATWDRSASPRVDGALLSEGRVDRDGFELRYDGSREILTLWDLSEDAAVYVFGPEDMQSETPPDGVRLAGDDRAFALTFEDPETGADLVTFTADDMAFLIGMATADLEAASGVDPDWPEQWLGWSADGTAWGWQSLNEALGIHDANIWAEFAVGQDFLITRVASFQPPNPADPTDSGQVLPTRWFLARVP